MVDRMRGVVPLVDAHCHVGTDPQDVVYKDLSCGTMTRAVMSSNVYDWQRLEQLNLHEGSLPQYRGFGVHPWYSHLFSFSTIHVSKMDHYSQVLVYPDTESDTAIFNKLVSDVLPDPVSIDEFVSNVDFSQVDLIGEIGLDKSFTIPISGFYQGRDIDGSVTRTKIKVKLEHQLQVFEYMCNLANKHSLNVSVHDVNCHLLLFDTCKKHLLSNATINICLHSFVGSVEFITTQWIKAFTQARFYLSVSKYINFKKLDGSLDYSSVPKSCILTETDYIIDSTDKKQLEETLEYLIQQLTRLLELQDTTHTKQLIYNNFIKFMHRDE